MQMNQLRLMVAAQRPFPGNLLIHSILGKLRIAAKTGQPTHYLKK
jgi:hypothetical protein